MEKSLFGIPNSDVYIVSFILVFFVVLEVVNGYLDRSNKKRSDWIQEFGGYLALGLTIKPAIIFTAMYLGMTFFPSYKYAISEMNFLFGLLGYLLIDDLLQYWYHRSAHEYQFLWKLHRPHHQAEEMGFFISYRNAWLYYVLMPNIWWVGIIVFLGGAKAVALGLILKQLVIIGSHSTIHWDKFLYERKGLTPILKVLERIFITPAFHHAHHGKSKVDGVGNPNGNFGNMFSIWDQLFGTAQFKHALPQEYGLPNDPKEHWTAAYFYPFVTSKNKESEISRGYKKEKTATIEPIDVKLEKGKKYLWCQCGLSKTQPFCDGSHHGTKKQPLVFEAKRTGEARICNCKITKTGPFCDNSHVQLKEI